MSEISSVAIEVVTHGVARLEYRMNFFHERPKPFPASSFFSKRFWSSASKRQLEDCSVSFHLMDMGIVRVTICSEDGYIADDEASIDDINYDYFGDVRIADASRPELQRAAEVILSLMKAWAQEQLASKTAVAA